MFSDNQQTLQTEHAHIFIQGKLQLGRARKFDDINISVALMVR